MKNMTKLLKKTWEIFEIVLRWGLIDVLHLKRIEKNWQKIMQFIKFSLVGLSNTVISYIIYLIGISLGVDYLIASIVGFVVSIINAFYWNNKYVFTQGSGEKRSILKSFIKTFLSYAGTGLFLANILLVIDVQYLGMSKVIAPVFNLLITIPLNYILNKVWAFASK